MDKDFLKRFITGGSTETIVYDEGEEQILGYEVDKVDFRDDRPSTPITVEQFVRDIMGDEDEW